MPMEIQLDSFTHQQDYTERGTTMSESTTNVLEEAVFDLRAVMNQLMAIGDVRNLELHECILQIECIMEDLAGHQEDLEEEV